jgi:uncharacterized protein
MTERQENMIFFAVALGIYVLMNFYVLRRGWQALAGTGTVRVVVLAALLVLASCMFIGRIIGARRPGPWPEFITAVGYVYLGALTILLCLVAAVDLLRLVNAFVRIFPASFQAHRQLAGRVGFFTVVGTAAVLLGFGAVRGYHPRVRTLDLGIAKSAGRLTSLNIVVVSDLHFGPLVRSGFLKKILDDVCALSPDLFLFPGDIMTEELPPAELEKILALFRSMTSTYGAFAVTGNHETYGDLAKNIALFGIAGIRLLQDETVLVADAFYIAGRMDRSVVRRGERRKALTEILAGIDMRRPVILMDHQPLDLRQAEDAGVDLQVSGHTHGGQMFPFTLINKLVYEKDKGSYRRGATQYDISEGAGFWGPPFRIGSRSEIVRIRVLFKS